MILYIYLGNPQDKYRDAVIGSLIQLIWNDPFSYNVFCFTCYVLWETVKLCIIYSYVFTASNRFLCE